MPPSMEVLRERLERRGTEKPEVIEERVRIAGEEIIQAKASKAIKKTFVNDQFERFYQELVSFLIEVYPHYIF